MNILANQLPSLFGQPDMVNMTVNGSEFVNTFLTSASRASPLMQGFLFLYRLVEDRFGLDPSLVLTVLGLGWGFAKMASQLQGMIMGFVDQYLRSSITVSENDPIFRHLMKWMSAQPAIRSDRYLMAETEWSSAWENGEEGDELLQELTYTDVGDNESAQRYLNFSNQAVVTKPRYVPAMGSTRFWHKGTYFRFSRSKETFVNTNGFSAMKDTEEIKVSCYGRSVLPVKGLLAEAKALYYEDTHQRTTIYRPRAKEFRRDYNLWQQITSRPIRPMRTVVLDPKEKHEVLADINEYLHPSTPRWYASRGIPLRRGYLFHGPPGTGKTSFSFALAGVFGIDIYVISLQDVNVTEEDLAALFAKLPRRCIVLLEDIDSAGLERGDKDDGSKEDTEEKDGDEKTTGDEGDKKLTNGDVAKAETTEKEEAEDVEKPKKKSKKRKSSKDSDDSDSSSSSSSSEDGSSKKKKKDKKKKKKKQKGNLRKKRVEKGSGRGRPVTTISMESISLSGLLNAIDGVASHEGRVLIMTTNKPESLDEALVRPGRVDLQVGFTNASTSQAVDLFIRMYEAEAPPLKKGEGIEEEAIGKGELKDIADRFGELVPSGMLSPAEIQGFLLKRKKSPRRALEDAPGWIEGTMKQKQAKSKVTTVQ